ncbi:MAG: OmpA family protein [Frankia sp.]
MVNGSQWRRPALVLVVVAAIVGAFFWSGSGGSSTTAVASGSGASCSGLSPTARAGTGRTVLLVDRSRSTRGTGGPDYLEQLAGELQAAVRRGDLVGIAGFDGTAASVSWTDIATRIGNDPTRRKLAAAQALTCLTDRLHAVATAPAQTSGSDVLGALTAVGAVPRSSPAPDHVVIATDGLANTGCTDLDELAIGGNIATDVSVCQANHEIPHLPDSDVTFLGIGSPAAGSALPSSSQLTWLTSLWIGLCARATGNAAACHHEPLTSSETGVSPAPSGADDPPVVFPKVVVSRAGGKITVALPDAMLFETDSSSLTTAADAALGRVLATVRQAPGTVVQIIGHTDSRGSTAHNEVLSIARAQAVAHALHDRYGLAVPLGTGVGESQPACSPEYHPDGTPDAVAMACNRRVDVVIQITGGLK